MLVVMSASKITTRGVISCDKIDQPPSQFNYSSLPTNGDILKAWNWERIEKRVNGREPSWKQIRKFLVSKLEEIWARASIPTVSTVTIESKVEALHSQYRNLQKSFKRDKNKGPYIKKDMILF